MNTETTALGRTWTAEELRNLPPEQRNAILEAAAALAEEEYRTNPELTAFEAFGKDDLYGDSADGVFSPVHGAYACRPVLQHGPDAPDAPRTAAPSSCASGTSAPR